MCGSDDVLPVGEHEVSRRAVLQGGAAVALGAVVLGRPGAAGAAPISAASFTGTDPVVAAMHVHADYSEGAGSWEQQYVEPWPPVRTCCSRPITTSAPGPCATWVC